MHILKIAAVILLLSVTVAFGQTCPSAKAAAAGISPIETFHEIMHPAWHTAYPAKDFDALIKAAPEFEKAYVPIAKLEPVIKNPARKEAFVRNLEEFGKFVAEYAAAAKAGNKELVYELMPKLHEAFEKTSAACVSISYPEVEGLTITARLIVEKHIPANNTNGIVGSTSTLVTKVSALDEKSIPEPLQGKKAEFLQEFAAWTKLAGQMKESCDKKDMETYGKLATELYARINDFSAKYL